MGAGESHALPARDVGPQLRAHGRFVVARKRSQACELRIYACRRDGRSETFGFHIIRYRAPRLASHFRFGEAASAQRWKETTMKVWVGYGSENSASLVIFG
jgi:hypothetical protein